MRASKLHTVVSLDWSVSGLDIQYTNVLNAARICMIFYQNFWWTHKEIIFKTFVQSSCFQKSESVIENVHKKPLWSTHSLFTRFISAICCFFQIIVTDSSCDMLRICIYYARLRYSPQNKLFEYTNIMFHSRGPLFIFRFHTRLVSIIDHNTVCIG